MKLNAVLGNSYWLMNVIFCKRKIAFACRSQCDIIDLMDRFSDIFFRCRLLIRKRFFFIITNIVDSVSQNKDSFVFLESLRLRVHLYEKKVTEDRNKLKFSENLLNSKTTKNISLPKNKKKKRKKER